MSETEPGTAWRLGGPILRAALLFGSGTLVVKAFSFLKEMTVADRFGLSAQLDAFVLAFALVTTFGCGVAGGAMRSAFIPVLREVRVRRSLHEEQRLFRHMLTWVLMFAGSAASVLYIVRSPVVSFVGYGFSAQQRELAASLVVLLLPFLLLSTVSALFHATLQAGKRFWLSSLAPVAVPIATLSLLLALRKEVGVRMLAWGAGIGAVAELVFLAALLARRGYTPIPLLRGAPEELRRAMSRTGILLLGGVLMATTMLVDQAMASSLGAGSISALNYGSRVSTLINSLLSTALATAVLPYFSEMAAHEDWAACRSSLRRYSRWVGLASLPAILAVVVVSPTIVRVIFERGAFTAAATGIVASVQSAYLLHIPPYLVSLLAVRMLQAMGDNRVIVAIAGVNVVVNIIFNLWFMRIWGVTGIALATAVVYCVSAASCLYCAERAIAARVAPGSIHP